MSTVYNNLSLYIPNDTCIHTFCHLYIFSATCTYLLLSKLFIPIATKHTYCYLYVPTASIIYCIRYLCTPIITCSYLLPLYIPITTFTYLLTASKQQVFDITCTYLLLLDMPYLSSPVHIFCIYCTGYLYIPIITWSYLLSTIQTLITFTYLLLVSSRCLISSIALDTCTFLLLLDIAIITCTYFLYILHWIPVHTYCQVAGGWTRLLRSLSRGGWQSPRVEGQSQDHHRDQGSAKQLSTGQEKQRRLFCKN